MSGELAWRNDLLERALQCLIIGISANFFGGVDESF